jgi:hypothetical protein
MDQQVLKQKLTQGLHSRRASLGKRGVLPLFEDGFYKGVEWATMNSLIHHLALVSDFNITAPEAIALLVRELETLHLLSHEALGEGLSCEAVTTINKILDTITSGMLKETSVAKIQDILSRYGVTYIPEVPKEKAN